MKRKTILKSKEVMLKDPEISLEKKVDELENLLAISDFNYMQKVMKEFKKRPFFYG